MFCKYCGNLVKGTTCTKCGKDTILFAHSTELEKILDKTSTPNQDVYNEGFNKGYQKGLSEGYQNGKDEFIEKDSTDNEPQDKAKRISKKLLFIVCGIVFTVATVISGFVSSHIGYQSGYKNGTSEGEMKILALEAESDDKYNEARETGRKEGEAKAKKDFELELAKLKETPTPSLTPTPPSTIQTPAPNKQILFKEGDVSEGVHSIQERLYELGFLTGEKDNAVDSKYGPQTKNAVIEFQKQNHILPATGEVDNQTYNALFPQPSNTISTDEEERKETDKDDSEQRKMDEKLTQNTDGLFNLWWLNPDAKSNLLSLFFCKAIQETGK